MAEPTPAYNRALELLADGQWHDRHRVALEVGKVYPPGEAVRFIESTRQWKAKAEGRDAGHRKVGRSDDFLVMAGQKALAAKVLNNKTRFETRTVDGVRQIRLLPVKPHWRRGTGKREPQKEEA